MRPNFSRALFAAACAVAVAACNCGGDPCHGVSCPTGKVCVGDNADCVTQDCQGQLCGAGNVCQGGVCVPVKCWQQQPCPSGQACAADGKCYPSACPGSADGGACGQGQLCDPANGACVPADCVPHVDCPDGTLCGTGAKCYPVDGCDNAPNGTCPDGQVCVSNSCVPPACATCPACCLSGACPNVVPSECNLDPNPPLPDGGIAPVPIPPYGGADGGPGGTPTPIPDPAGPGPILPTCGFYPPPCVEQPPAPTCANDPQPDDPPCPTEVPPVADDESFNWNVIGSMFYGDSVVSTSNPNFLSARGYPPGNPANLPLIPLQETIVSIRRQAIEEAVLYANAGTVFLGNMTRCSGMESDYWKNVDQNCRVLNQTGLYYRTDSSGIPLDSPYASTAWNDFNDVPSLDSALFSDRYSLWPLGLLGGYAPILVAGPREYSLMSSTEDGEYCFQNCSPLWSTDSSANPGNWDEVRETRYRLGMQISRAKDPTQRAPRAWNRDPKTHAQLYQPVATAPWWSGDFRMADKQTPAPRFIFLATEDNGHADASTGSGRAYSISAGQLTWLEYALRTSGLKVVFSPNGVKDGPCRSAWPFDDTRSLNTNETLLEILKRHNVRVFVEGTHWFEPKPQGAGWDISDFICQETTQNGGPLAVVRVPAVYRINPDDGAESAWVQLLFQNPLPFMNSVTVRPMSSGARRAMHTYGLKTFTF